MTSNSRPISCRPPVSQQAQVKILRRPAQRSSENISPSDHLTNRYLAPDEWPTLDSASQPIPSNNKPVNPSATSSKNIITNGGSVDPRKTYQERADEYAKARLRILGSAFPEANDSENID